MVVLTRVIECSLEQTVGHKEQIDLEQPFKILRILPPCQILDILLLSRSWKYPMKISLIERRKRLCRPPLSTSRNFVSPQD